MTDVLEAAKQATQFLQVLQSQHPFTQILAEKIFPFRSDCRQYNCSLSDFSGTLEQKISGLKQ